MHANDCPRNTGAWGGGGGALAESSGSETVRQALRPRTRFSWRDRLYWVSSPFSAEWLPPAPCPRGPANTHTDSKLPPQCKQLWDSSWRERVRNRRWIECKQVPLEKDTWCHHPLRGEPRACDCAGSHAGCSPGEAGWHLSPEGQVHLRCAPDRCQPRGLWARGSRHLTGLEGVPGPGTSPAFQRWRGA